MTTSLDCYSIADVCRMRKISKPWVYRLLATGKLKAKKDGRRTIVTAESFNSYFGSLPDFESKAAA